MGELRWVLLGLGVVLLLAVYAWGKGFLRKLHPPWFKVAPWSLGARGQHDESTSAAAEADPEAQPDPGESRAGERPPERVVTVRFIPHRKKLGTDRAVLALRAAGLRHGRYGIFHMHAEDLGDDPVFSVASLTEPGSFDLNNLADSAISGMSFFMVLPGRGDPVARFDSMVDTARSLARDLDAELHDEKGSSWSVQRERYIREEMIQYRHQLSHSADAR